MSSTRARIYEELKDRRRRGEAIGDKAIRDSLTEIVGKKLNRKSVFLLPGFAKFVVVRKSATKAGKRTNPFTGEKMILKAKPARKIIRVLPDDSNSGRRSTHSRSKSQSGRRAVPILPEPIYALEVRALADRVFGDERKATAWLNHPNRALSGQTPADLLTDELGAAVVRETLERIDYGIFA